MPRRIIVLDGKWKPRQRSRPVCAVAGAVLRTLVLVAGLTTSATLFAQGWRALFSPWDDIEGALVTMLGEARRDVRMQAYVLTSRPLTRALVAARRRGVDVEVIVDAEMARRAGAESLQQLADAGVPVWIETRYAAAHNKVVVVDAGTARPVVVTGSYNFTWSAQARNAENILMITGDSALAGVYRDNWRRHRDEAIAYRDWIEEKQDKTDAK